MKSFIKKNYIELLLVIIAFLFSFWLMFSTFSYNGNTSELLIPLKPWGDFASHIPLIRSFSLGNNLPPEYPLFPGEPIRYHFLFYALVGLLERLGLRIDLALNIPSALSFFFLLVMIYLFAKLLFKTPLVGTISVVLFLFHGSLGFLYFFQKYPISFPQTFFDITKNTTFPAFAPYDQTLISGGFWNLNVFTNQRHFALALSLALLTVYLIIKSAHQKKPLSYTLSILCGIIIASFSFFHGAVFIMAIALMISLFFLFPLQRKSVIIIGIATFLFSLPRTLFLLHVESSSIFKLQPGYLVAHQLSLFTWLRYWILNLGFGFFLIPVGFMLANTTAKKIFLAFSTLFIIGNLFQFSPDIATNHKFFNLWLIVGNMFIAFALYTLWQRRTGQKILVIIFLFFLTLSGIIDFFPIRNDQIYTVLDYPKNQDVLWIIKNTPPNAVFLNSSYLYHPANLAGRKIFLGWPYYPWSLGYDTTARDILLKQLYNSSDLAFICMNFKANHIRYVALDAQPDPAILVNKVFFLQNFDVVYKNPETGFIIVDALKTCHKLK